MNEDKDIRWKQRFQNFTNALKQLKNAHALRKERAFTELELQGVVQAFEVSQELSWKVMKDFLEHQGKTELYGSRDTIKAAFNSGLLSRGDIWLDTIKNRNKTSHIYDEEEILDILEIIFTEYLPIFTEFEEKMKTYL
ncbi:nucleotidyltransferase [Flavobacterium cyanobacteriorum]|uniref:Nucleotidyltransferase n=1 Tax=Flavobacterium cyanobacteriorum TaxID=2022802 RepID=A0A255ZDF4_9FLAO|nr:nucleotidyltransferase substrate binding protein [Flavobacterium cyanobacteriorum]OYQ39583.1 nucleotidyltransferase [Flavobacterium cyanobacteriorum]